MSKAIPHLQISHIDIPSNCPACDALWETGIRPEDGVMCYSVISVYDRMADATIGWKCPVCGVTWHRDGTPVTEASPIRDTDI